MPTLELDAAELAAVIMALKEKLDRDRFPRAPRLAPSERGKEPDGRRDSSCKQEPRAVSGGSFNGTGRIRRPDVEKSAQQ
jgi:hypothetical protein